MKSDGDSNDESDSTYDDDDDDDDNDLMMMIMMLTIAMIRAFTTKSSRYNSYSCGPCGRKRHIYILYKYIDDKTPSSSLRPPTSAGFT